MPGDSILRAIKNNVEFEFIIENFKKHKDFEVEMREDEVIRIKRESTGLFYDFKAGKGKVRDPKTDTMKEVMVAILVNTRGKAKRDAFQREREIDDEKARIKYELDPREYRHKSNPPEPPAPDYMKPYISVKGRIKKYV